TEHVLKEELLVRGRGQLEEAIFMVGTPQSLLSEAAATVAPEVVAAGRVEELSAQLLGPLGIAYEADTGAAVRPHAETLAHVSTNVSILVHAQGLPLDDARAYARQWSLRSDERIEQGLRFVTDATWRAYAFCYTEGLRLARAFVAGDRLRLRRLL